jgi:hypothetical protein
VAADGAISDKDGTPSSTMILYVIDIFSGDIQFTQTFDGPGNLHKKDNWRSVETRPNALVVVPSQTGAVAPIMYVGGLETVQASPSTDDALLINLKLNTDGKSYSTSSPFGVPDSISVTGKLRQIVREGKVYLPDRYILDLPEIKVDFCHISR